MNWNSLMRSQLKRFHQKPESHGSTSEDVSNQLELLIAEFDKAENATKLLGYSVKKLLDRILCMSKYEINLAEGALKSGVFQEEATMQTLLEEWSSLAIVDNTIGDEYVISLQKNLIEPLKHLRRAFADLRSQIRLTEAVQLDTIKFQRKVSSYSAKDKTGQNLVKLQENKQALEASQREFARQKEQLVNDLTKFNTGSIELTKPLLEGYMAAELAWVEAKKRTQTQRTCLMAATSSRSQTDRLKVIEDKFRFLNDLSICSNSK